ncbi:hypothetical protein GCM10022222_85560 [Amycolatopsis ultiminotia]|uniref:Uncharacterized protein n=1 Tax=Amycolatopsis ultiminotia TaxID=543629 RepID=A0ABP6YQQ5_9PSEU
MSIFRRATIAGLVTGLAGALSVQPTVADATPPPPPALSFGIYPGGYAGGGSENGKPDDVRKANVALDALHRNGSTLEVRDYISCRSAFPDPGMRFLGPGRRLDLVLEYQGESPQDWLTCVRRDVRRYAAITDALAVTAEQNVLPQPGGNAALVQGVIAARNTADEQNAHHLQIGFDEVANTQPFVDFWNAIAQLGGTAFARSVGFVGVELYPNTGLPHTEPVPDLGAWLDQTLDVVRTKEMPLAGLHANVPIRVAENGWSTYAADRSPARQAQALTTEIQAIHADRGVDNVTSYALFDLRDDVTGSPNPFDDFGILTDDYQPKPMFWIYRGLIAGLSGHR